MTTEELIQKVYDSITDRSFSGWVYATTGGRCADGWDCEADLELTAQEITDVIGSDDATEVYREKIYDLAREMAWPDGETEEAEDYSYGGHFDSLDDYISNINELISDIEDGDVTEENIDERLSELEE